MGHYGNRNSPTILAVLYIMRQTMPISTLHFILIDNTRIYHTAWPIQHTTLFYEIVIFYKCQ